MGIFDRFKDQAQDKAKDISNAAEEEINEKTGDKYADKVDKAQQQINEKLGLGEDKPEGEQQS
ncbi:MULTISPECIES: Rv0909 family putative TA system antitoxin [Streptomyces]|uniref:Rv0909 family putative TA system antitoxin n=1 Tax=Streptomyces TaxID=1883 RepID=UPI0006EBDEF1|nr:MULTISPECIES: Rv0909 family putative TA system antitoxin [Streptomyces]MCF3121929.1 antitoxin [Streptomyces arenae]